MFKKNYFYLSIAIIATFYITIQLMFYPKLTSLFFIRLIGGLFLLQTIGYVLDIQKIYLQNKVKKLYELISTKQIKTE